MYYNFRYSILLLLVMAVFSSCTRMKDIGILNVGNFSDTTGALKDVADNMNIGFAAYQGDAGFSKYFPIIVQEANMITPGNEMKYGSIVQDDGSLVFTSADALYNKANSAGLGVYGHTLLWYQQQNSTYLNSIVGDIGNSTTTNALTNGDFENWSSSGSAPSGWSYYNGASYFSRATTPNVNNGNYALAATGYGASTGSDWHVQIAKSFTAVSGHTYSVTFYAKGSQSGGRVQYEWQPGSGDAVGTQYNATTITTNWAQYSESYSKPMTTSNSSVTITFDLAANAVGSTVYIDDVVIVDLTQAAADAAANSSATAIAQRLDSVLKLWIIGTSSAPGIVTHYAGKIPAWDVANEVFADNGSLRSASAGTTIPSGYFYWTDYLGKQGIVNAFKYAHEADSSAKLFINDYNLEASAAKTDSMVALVAYLKAQGAQVDGIGTQMHCSLSTSDSGIDYMFKKLAATGLKIRISELDVAISASPTDASVADPITLGYQASMYKYIVSSYLKNVPSTQRYGITVWGVDDPDSWKSSYLPLMWDKNFAKKPAYSAMLQALKNK